MLCGDDAITIPLIALGGRGVISVVSNEIPGEMTQADAARAWPAISPERARCSASGSPLMEVNFVRSRIRFR